MSYKVDISNIVKDHFNSLINQKTERPDFRDWFFFLIVPMGLASYLVVKQVFINQEFSNSLFAGLSIYVGLSINFLMLIFELSTKDHFKQPEKKPILKQIVANISITTIYSLLIILLSLLATIEALRYPANFLLYFVATEFVITMLMVLKRIYNVLIGSIDL